MNKLLAQKRKLIAEKVKLALRLSRVNRRIKIKTEENNAQLSSDFPDCRECLNCRSTRGTKIFTTNYLCKKADDKKIVESFSFCQDMPPVPEWCPYKVEQKPNYRPSPKFKVGQVVHLPSLQITFEIKDYYWSDSVQEWVYRGKDAIDWDHSSLWGDESELEIVNE